MKLWARESCGYGGAALTEGEWEKLTGELVAELDSA